MVAGAALNNIPVSEYSGLAPGLTYYAFDMGSDTYWAAARLVPAPSAEPSAPTRAQVASQDAGSYYVFSRPKGGSWTADAAGNTGPGTPCPVTVPLPSGRDRLGMAGRGLSTGGRCLAGRGGVSVPNVLEAAGGEAGLLRLASAWHARVVADEVVGHAFSHGIHPQHTERLAAYWGEALGGPTAFSDHDGDETSVVRMHSGNGPHDEMDRRAIACFDQALGDIGMAVDSPLGHALHDYFAWATTTTMARYPRSADDVPSDLSIPHWSWDGLQG